MSVLVYSMAVGVAGGAVEYLRSGFDPAVKFVAGVLMGGVLVYLNFLWLSRIIRSLITGASSKKGFTANLTLKVLFLYAAVIALVALKLVAPIPFIIGLSSIMAAALIGGLLGHREAIKNRDD